MCNIIKNVEYPYFLGSIEFKYNISIIPVMFGLKFYLLNIYNAPAKNKTWCACYGKSRDKCRTDKTYGHGMK
jgi:hypothetical protein